MPLFPEIKVDTPRYCNLRQALQWLKDDLQPVAPEFEPALGRSRRFNTQRDYSREKAAIYAALLAKQLKLFGRLGEGRVMHIDWDDIAFQRYGDLEEVSIAQIKEAGFDNLRFEAGELCRITEWEEEDRFDPRPMAGWKYVDLAIPTVDLMRVFPPSDSTELPLTIELKSSDPGQSPFPSALPRRSLLFLHAAIEWVADCTMASRSEAATALHDALCSGELTAHAADGNAVPCNVWLSCRPSDFTNHIERGEDRCWEANGLRYINPTLTAKSVDGWLSQAVATVPKHLAEPRFVRPERHVPVEQSEVQADLLPPYSDF